MDITVSLTKEESSMLLRALADHYHIMQVEEDLKYLKNIDALESKLLRAKYVGTNERATN
jgi:hypothetical protein